MPRTCIVCGAAMTRSAEDYDDRFARRQTCSAVCAVVLGDDDLVSDKRPGKESSADADETDRRMRRIARRREIERRMAEKSQET